MDSFNLNGETLVYWHLRCFSKAGSEAKKWLDTITMLRSSLVEYFPGVSFTLLPELTPNFSLYPFQTPNDKNINTVVCAANISGDVYIKGDLLGFNIPGGDKLPSSHILSFCYKEQMTLRVGIYWFEVPDDSEKQINENALSYVLSSLAQPSVIFLSAQSIDHSSAPIMSDLFSKFTIESLKRKEPPVPSVLTFTDPYYVNNFILKEFMNKDGLSLQSMMDRWDSKSIQTPFSQCQLGDAETRESYYSNIITDASGSYAFSTKLLPKTLDMGRSVCVLVDDGAIPIWHRTYCAIDGEKVSVWSRMVFIPEISNGKQWLDSIRQYPSGLWFGDDGWASCLIIGAHSSSEKSKCLAWIRSGLSIERDVDENGSKTFDLSIETEDKGEVVFFSGDTSDLVKLFEKMSETNQTDIIDIEEAKYLSSLAGCILDRDNENETDFLTLQ